MRYGVRHKVQLLATTFLVVMSAGMPELAAQEAPAAKPASAASKQSRADYDIPAMPVADALAGIARQSGLAVDLDGARVIQATSRPVRGKLTARQAVAAALSGTGVGYTFTSARSVTILSSEAGRAANAQEVALDTISVDGRSSGNDGQVGYVATRTSSATKSDAPLRDIPQSISVVTQQFIKDTSARSIGDAVRYVPGVSVQQGEGNRDGISIRGQSTTADFFVNGIRDDAQYFRDTYNSQRIEVLKGPNALIFGRGGSGGVINRVLKEADGTPIREVTVQTGSYSNKRVSSDLGGKVSDTFSARLNTMYENSDSYRNGVNLERYGINPTITWQPTAQTKIKLSYEYFHDDRTADRGIPSYQGRPFPTDPSTFFGNPDLSTTYVNAHILSGVLEHDFANGLKVKSQSRFADYEKFYQNVFSGAVNAAGTEVALNAYNNQNDRQNYFNQTDWTYTAQAGSVKHKFLFGTEIGRQYSDNYRNTGFFNNATTSISVPTSNPTNYTPVTFRQQTSDANAHTTLNVAAAYLQDHIELTRWLHVIGGVRVEQFDLDYRNNKTGDMLNRTDNLVSPRVGVVLKPVDEVSFYVSHSVSYLPSSGDQFGSLTTGANGTANLKPEKFTNNEVGVKWDIYPTLSATAALYQLDRENTTANDPNNPGVIVQTGSSRSQGIELGLNGYITDQWQIAAGYGYQDVRYTSTTTNATEGARVPHVPLNTFSLWNRYQFNAMWGVGLGIIHQTDFYPATDNQVSVPGFTRVDAAVFWKLNDQIRAQVNIENIFDTNYYAFANSNNNITPGSPRALRVSLTGNF